MPRPKGARDDYPIEAARRACLVGADALIAARAYLDDPRGSDSGRDFGDLKAAVDTAAEGLTEAQDAIPRAWDATVPVTVLDAIESAIGVLSDVHIHTFIAEAGSHIVANEITMRALLSEARETLKETD